MELSTVMTLGKNTTNLYLTCAEAYLEPRTNQDRPRRQRGDKLANLFQTVSVPALARILGIQLKQVRSHKTFILFLLLVR
jgi:hypothetical protein